MTHRIHDTHSYFVVYPEHSARKDDPHYRDFNHLHRVQRPTARCAIGVRLGFDGCRDPQGGLVVVDDAGEMSGLELHHTHIEFAAQNGVDLTALEVDYPGVSDPDSLGAWVESASNLVWYCAFHHRGPTGVHAAAHADFEAGQYVKGLLEAP